MIQKPIRLSWLDRFARKHFRGKIGRRWLWSTFFAKKDALEGWQSIILFDILWDKTVGRNEDQLVALVANWLYKPLHFWHPDGFDAALNLVLDTVHMRIGWWAAHHGPSVVPEYFPRIIKAAEECARECAQSEGYITERLFELEVRKRLQA